MRARAVARSVVVVVACAALFGACVDKAAEAKKRADAQKAALDAEAKAAADARAAQEKQDFDDAIAGCTTKGDGAKCVALSNMFANGKGAPKDASKAMDALTKACALKSKDGCKRAAAAETDPKKKLAAFSAACDLGDVDSCIEGAKIADASGATAKKPADKPTMVLLGKACGLGNVMACTARGVGLVGDDPGAAADSFSKGCEAGEPTSCFQLSELYKAGKGVKKKDAAKAAALKKKACDAGLKDACAP